MNTEKNKNKIFAAIAIFWLVVFGAFITYKELTVITGKDVLLKTIPVDPRDLFRGDYVILTYEISNISTEEIANPSDVYKSGDTVYVLLELDENGVGNYKSIQKERPSDELYIKGRIQFVNKSLINNSYIYSIQYGIESYFVPVGRGLEIERNLGEIYTNIKLDKRGRAIIRSLVLDGETIDFK